jgi:hypothetical protein
VPELGSSEFGTFAEKTLTHSLDCPGHPPQDTLAPPSLAPEELVLPPLAPEELALPLLAPEELALPLLAPEGLALPLLAPEGLALPLLAPEGLALPLLAPEELALLPLLTPEELALPLLAPEGLALPLLESEGADASKPVVDIVSLGPCAVVQAPLRLVLNAMVMSPATREEVRTCARVGRRPLLGLRGNGSGRNISCGLQAQQSVYRFMLMLPRLPHLFNTAPQMVRLGSNQRRAHLG